MSFVRAVPDTLEPARTWLLNAACAGLGDLMFPGTTGSEIKTAKDICHSCPVIRQCGRWAYDNRIPFGVWGGLSEAERRAMLRRHGVRIKDTDPDTETEAAA